MDKTEIDQIARFLIDVRDCLGKDCAEGILQAHLMELYWIIDRLTNALPTAEDRDLEVQMAALENEARLCKQGVEERLGAVGLSQPP